MHPGLSCRRFSCERIYEFQEGLPSLEFGRNFPLILSQAEREVQLTLFGDRALLSTAGSAQQPVAFEMQRQVNWGFVLPLGTLPVTSSPHSCQTDDLSSFLGVWNTLSFSSSPLGSPEVRFPAHSFLSQTFRSFFADCEGWHGVLCLQGRGRGMGEGDRLGS